MFNGGRFQSHVEKLPCYLRKASNAYNLARGAWV